MPPIFSVVIPVYKTEQYLSKCLQSILTQSFRDIEVIVVDDGSKGNAEEIVNSFHDIRLKYIQHEKNRSLLQARITGVKASSGEYIVPIDSDDFINEGLFTETTKLLTENPDTDIVFYQMRTIDGNRSSQWSPDFDKKFYSSKDFFIEMNRKKIRYWNLCGKVIRRSLYLNVLKKLNLSPDLFLLITEDMLLSLPLLAMSSKIVTTSFFGYNYVMHSGSAVHGLQERKKWETNIRDVSFVYTKLSDFFAKNAQEIDTSFWEGLDFFYKELCIVFIQTAASQPSPQREEFADYLYCHFNKQIFWDVFFEYYSQAWVYRMLRSTKRIFREEGFFSLVRRVLAKIRKSH